MTTSLTGANNDMVFTADATTIGGNDITVEYSTSNQPPGSNIGVSTVVNAILVNLKTSAGVVATSTVTQSTDDLADNETLTIGTTVYRFKSTPTLAYDVKIGASAAITLDNLKSAINASGTPGTEYFAGTLIHPNVTATTNTNTTQVIDAKVVGIAGNLIATTSTAANYSWTSTVMAGGQDVNQVLSLASEVKTAIEANTAGAALVDITNSGGDTGAGVVTIMAKANLTGGSSGIIPLFTVTGTCRVTVVGYVETTLAGASGTLVHGKTGTTNDLITILTGTNIVAGASIDGTTGVVTRGTAPAIIPLKSYFDGQTIFATVATATLTAGKINYLAYYVALTDNGSVDPT